MKRILLSIAVLALALVGCRRSQQSGTADLTIELLSPTTQAMNGDNVLQLRVTDADGAPVDDATLALIGDMTHAGMVPVLAEADSGENGLYLVPFTWTMAGDWIVSVRATLPDGAWREEQFDVSVNSGT